MSGILNNKSVIMWFENIWYFFELMQIPYRKVKYQSETLENISSFARSWSWCLKFDVFTVIYWHWPWWYKLTSLGMSRFQPAFPNLVRLDNLDIWISLHDCVWPSQVQSANIVTSTSTISHWLSTTFDDCSLSFLATHSLRALSWEVWEFEEPVSHGECPGAMSSIIW